MDLVRVIEANSALTVFSQAATMRSRSQTDVAGSRPRATRAIGDEYGDMLRGGGGWSSWTGLSKLITDSLNGRPRATHASHSSFGVLAATLALACQTPGFKH